MGFSLHALGRGGEVEGPVRYNDIKGLRVSVTKQLGSLARVEARPCAIDM